MTILVKLFFFLPSICLNECPEILNETFVCYGILPLLLFFCCRFWGRVSPSFWYLRFFAVLKKLGWHSWDAFVGRSKIEAIAFYVLFMCISRPLWISIFISAPDQQNRMGRNHRAAHQGAHVRQSHHGRMCLGSTRSKYISLYLKVHISIKHFPKIKF